MMRALLTILLLLAVVPAAQATTFNVTSNNDADDGTCNVAHCSLREAINAANSGFLADEITFDAAMTISPATALPSITGDVTINGTTAADCTGTPENIVLDGNGAFDGLHLAAGSDFSRICRLNIREFADGIQIDSNFNDIEGSRIGTDLTGEIAAANTVGVRVNGGDNNEVGKETTNGGNIISGNTTAGVVIAGAASSNVVEANLIGLDKDGVSAIANGDGVVVDAAASNTTIGGTAEASRNVISGNSDDGIEAADGNIYGNYIGTDVTGTAPVENDEGVVVNTSAVAIGSGSPGARNVISGNHDHGIELNAVAGVYGNWIGPAADGDVLTGTDQGIGVRVVAGTSAIGGAGAAGNVIAGQLSAEIRLDGAVDNTIVRGNLIGLMPDGLTPADVGATGLSIGAFATDTIVGGTGAGDGNTIAGNSEGLYIEGDGTIVEGNVVGLDTAGNAEPSGDSGIAVQPGAEGTRIGDAAAGAGNVVSGNGDHGIAVQFNAPGTVIQGNLIGLGPDGVTPRGNERAGIDMRSTEDSAIGGEAPGAGNRIAHNGEDGIGFFGTTFAVPILGNEIFANGLPANVNDVGIDLGNDGVTLNDPGDVDAGANALQNFPVLTAAEANVNETQVEGTLDTTPGVAHRVEVFASTACDDDGHGQGEHFLGAFEMTPGSGPAAFAATVGASTPGQQVTATATNLDTGDTSEFSACLASTELPLPPPPDTGGGTTTTTTTPSTTPPVTAPVVQLPLPVPKFPAKLRVLRNGIDDGVLDMLIEVTSRAVTPGAVFSIDYESSGRHTRFTVPITGTQVKVRKKLPSSQPKDTGITTVTYAGNSVVDPDEARLRAADGKSLLVRSSSSLTNGRLSVAGTVTERARGVVRIRMSYAKADGSTGFLDWNARISGGKWSLAETLTGDTAKGGQLSIQFTGYEPAGLRGEQTAKAVP